MRPPDTKLSRLLHKPRFHSKQCRFTREEKSLVLFPFLQNARNNTPESYATTARSSSLLCPNNTVAWYGTHTKLARERREHPATTFVFIIVGILVIEQSAGLFQVERRLNRVSTGLGEDA